MGIEKSYLSIYVSLLENVSSLMLQKTFYNVLIRPVVPRPPPQLDYPQFEVSGWQIKARSSKWNIKASVISEEEISNSSSNENDSFTTA